MANSHLHLAPAPAAGACAITAAREVAGRHPIRVVLADDHAFMRHGLRLLLDGEEGLDVVEEAHDLSSAIASVLRVRPAVLVLDLRMGDGSGIQTIARLREKAPETQIVALSMSADRRFAQEALRSGAVGFVLKDLADAELPEAIRAAARGEQYASRM